jgi:hypothetical protein
MPRPEHPFDLANGVQGAAFRAIGVLFRLQVSLEDGCDRASAKDFQEIREVLILRAA